MTATESARLTIFEADRIERVRDYADEKYEHALANLDSDEPSKSAMNDATWWLQLREVMEEMLAADRDEAELGSWIRQYGLEDLQ